MTQWKATTKGGHQYRITAIDPDSEFPIRGEVDDSGFTVRCDWNKDGEISPGSESQYDLIPIEPEAPGPAKARVDLALAAMRHKAHCDAFQRAEDAVDESKKLLLDTFMASEKIEVVVKIDGDHYYFWVSGAKLFFRKIEVL
jgi:hypothetical protein